MAHDRVSAEQTGEASHPPSITNLHCTGYHVRCWEYNNGQDRRDTSRRRTYVLMEETDRSTGLQLALAYPCHLPPQNNSSVDPGRTPVYLNLLETSYPEDPCLLPKGLKCQSYLSLVSKSHFSSLDKKPSLSHIIKLQSLVKGETSPDFSR